MQCRRYFTFTEKLERLLTRRQLGEHEALKCLFGEVDPNLPHSKLQKFVSKFIYHTMELLILASLLGLAVQAMSWVVFAGIDDDTAQSVCLQLNQAIWWLLLPSAAAVLYCESYQGWLDSIGFSFRINFCELKAFTLRCLSTLVVLQTFLGFLTLLSLETTYAVDEWMALGPVPDEDRLKYSWFVRVYIDVEAFEFSTYTLIAHFIGPFTERYVPILVRLIIVWRLMGTLCRPIKTTWCYLTGNVDKSQDL